MDYESCLEYLHTQCKRNVPGGYERTKRMAMLVGNPQERLHVIHIAGTNGKGSTAAVIASILQQAGYQVGLFTSPHLERYEERIQINRQPITSSAFAKILTYLTQEIVPQLRIEGMGHPGEFELLTVASWLYFVERTDFVILEVGLGGRWDPTNVIQRPLLTVITPVSLDHCQILGNTVAEIAAEKAGILKPGVPVIVAPQESEGLVVISAMAERLQVSVTALFQNDLTLVDTCLQGNYQQINCNTALAAVKNLIGRHLIIVTESQIQKGLWTVSWPGRMEYRALKNGSAILLDGAHNQAGIAYLAENLRQLYADRELVLFLSILDDKESSQMLQEILSLASAVILTKPAHNQRAQHWKELQQLVNEIVPECPCRLYEHYAEGLRQEIANLHSGQLLCITGSLYLLGDCRQELEKLHIG